MLKLINHVQSASTGKFGLCFQSSEKNHVMTDKIREPNPHPNLSLTFFELWTLIFSSIICIATSQGPDEMHKVKQEESLPQETADLETNLGVSQHIPNHPLKQQKLMEMSDTSSLYVTSNLPGLIIEDIVFTAFRLNKSQQQSTIHTRILGGRLLRTTHIFVAKETVRCIQLFLKKNKDLNGARALDGQWEIGAEMLRGRLVRTAFRVMKSKRAQTLVQRLSKDRRIRACFMPLKWSLSTSPSFGLDEDIR